MHLPLIVGIATFCATAVDAQNWTAMTGTQIQSVLSDQLVTYENAIQIFYASGQTRYNAGQDNWGSWAVRGDQYCSQWPQSDRWDCYDMTQAGAAVLFVDDFGNVTEGRLDQ